MITFEVLKNNYVLETLEKGTEVIACDFATMRMINCKDLTVGAIMGFAEKPTTVFYKKVITNE